MLDTPTRGAREKTTQWVASPWLAMAIRIVAYAIPILVGWLAVRTVGPALARPAGWSGLAVWVVQATAVAVAATLLAQRAAQRLLPLAFLVNQSLVFPDRAPSRFGTALRANSLGPLDKRIEEMRRSHGDRSEQDAAVHALSLVAALSKHDRFTRGHTERVRAYAELIAEEMGVSRQDRQLLSWGVLLHDVGKLTVPAEILNKREPLTSDEWEVLNRHPEASAEFIAPLENWLGEWGLAAAQHHERFDGAGYPAGIAGREISLAARITAVADAYDVITSARSYKSPMSTEAARQELVRCAGAQFDPAVVRAMLQVSLGRQSRIGFFAWLAELPTAIRLILTSSAVGTTVTAAVATVAAVLLGPAIITAPPAEIAFVDTGAAEVTVDDPTASTATADAPALSGNGASPTTVAGTARPDTASSTTSVVPVESSTTLPDDDAAGTPTTTSSILTGPTTTTSTTTTSTTTTTTTTTSTTTTTTTTTTAPDPDQSLQLFLHNHASGNTESMRRLPMDTVAPGSSLFNYDTDRDSELGILVQKGSGLGEDADTKYQDWRWTTSADRSLTGATRLQIWIAAKDFTNGETVGLRGGVYVCSPTCSLVATDDWSGRSNGGWRRATLDFGTQSIDLTAGDRLQIRVVAPDWLTDDDVLLAFDSSANDAVFDIG